MGKPGYFNDEEEEDEKKKPAEDAPEDDSDEDDESRCGDNVDPLRTHLLGLRSW